MKTILLVEDESIIALAEKRLLEEFGYAVLLAGSGEEAERLALRNSPIVDLVLMDIDLGKGMDGPETARRILGSRNLPIVFLTSHSERDVVQKVRGITRYGYIIKNSGGFVLQSSIEMAFELFEAHERMRVSEARLKTLIRTIPDLVWLKDAEGVYMAGNPAFERFSGAAEKDLIGKTDYDLFDRETADFFRRHDRKAIERSSASVNEEWITFAADGRRALLETIKTPMRDESGRVLGVLGIGRDITERKRLEDALKESESQVKNKLHAITSPEGDIRSLDLSEIVDIPTLTVLMENFSSLTGMVVAILDLKGTVLLATGWQDICTKFHRKNPESAKFCTESDLYLAAGIKPGEYVDYKCKNGLWDIVTPLYVESRHIGNIYSGQFFYKDDRVDESSFASQAARYGFDVDAYLEALRKVPRFDKARISLLMDFLVKLTEYVSRLSVGNLRLARTTTEKGRAEEELSKSLKEKDMLLKELQHRVKNSLTMVSSLLSLNLAELDDPRSRRIFQEAVGRIHSISMIYEKLSASSGSDLVDLSVYIRDLAELLKDTYSAEADPVRIVPSLDEIHCDMRSAVSLGLLLNELLTNALKYAYPHGKAGEIRIALRSEGRELELKVSDDGPGLPAGFDIKAAKSLGLSIIHLLAEELGGDLRFESGPGLTVSLRFRPRKN